MSKSVSPSVIKRMLNDLSEDQKRKKKFKNIQKLVAAYNVGTTTKNVTLCQWLFPCQEKMAEESEVEGRQKAKESILARLTAIEPTYLA